MFVETREHVCLKTCLKSLNACVNPKNSKLDQIQGIPHQVSLSVRFQNPFSHGNDPMEDRKTYSWRCPCSTEPSLGDSHPTTTFIQCKWLDFRQPWDLAEIAIPPVWEPIQASRHNWSCSNLWIPRFFMYNAHVPAYYRPIGSILGSKLFFCYTNFRNGVSVGFDIWYIYIYISHTWSFNPTPWAQMPVGTES